ncbi:O-antigen ligase C-terminal domain-containing protein [Schlegelella sp. ID0723]|uniref:O-antigen ligase C-terminal domain-containing protein n=1 Tax=Piscinibacter koreensis TaxID=2742824 RepID=A0A7Y6NJR1_9BURK|nr:O-antigen ligase C-terminal domain-containing protein [Schlegelella koreensis]
MSGLTALAILAIAIPPLIAFNIAPSATIFNQVAALVGWGGFVLLLALALPTRLGPRSGAARCVVAALAILVLAALGASFGAAVPWSLSLSSGGMILAAILVVLAGAAAERAGLGDAAFRAFCIGLVAAGVGSSVVGVIQVFAPWLADGGWIAVSAFEGRATGNLRQPNHLSSLLMWATIAVVWLGEARVLRRATAAGLGLLFVFVVFLSASRTGMLGTLVLALWGLMDRRLSRVGRVLLLAAPLAYAVMWGGELLWAAAGHAGFGGAARASEGGELSSSRFAIWSNTLALIAAHPLWGVGFGEFNFAWTLTPFPDRPAAYFDHTHNLPLNFVVELGVPLAIVVLTLLLRGLFGALENGVADGRDEGEARVPMQRAAFVMVLMIALHSLLEYPLWYAYFLLPASLAFGLCIERPDARDILARNHGEQPTRPLVLAAMALMLAGSLTLLDYMRVAAIFTPPANAGPLQQRIEAGRHSVLFGHHADYAAATGSEDPPAPLSAFVRAPHYLLDARLMTAWARSYAAAGDVERARHVAARLKEFRNADPEAFFAVCDEPSATGARPFQCDPPAGRLDFRDFR